MNTRLLIGNTMIVLLSMICLSCGSKGQEKVPTPPSSATPKFEANWSSIKKNYKDPEWFNDAKFGIFIHWGAYAVPAYRSEWYPRWMYMDTATFSAGLDHESDGPSPVYTYHKERYGNQKDFGYKDFIPEFKGEKFDANAWIDLFKKAGAKYVIPVADHHDGFAMYKSNTTRWNAYEMGPKRDVLGELFEVGRQKGMIMGTSSHYAFNWSYYNKKKHFDTMDPQYADLYGSKGSDLNEPVSEEFKEKWWARTKDVIDNYQPDILWLDFYIDIPDFADSRLKLAAYYYNKGVEWDKEVVLQDKNFNHDAFPEGTVIYDLERGKLPGIRKLPWQTDTSIGKNSWCYVGNWESKTPNTLIDDLIDIVSKNGNLLLNVGPKADGTIPADQENVLLEIGKWLTINGEAIYDTEPWTIFGEGPTQVATGHHTEKQNEELTAADVRFTHKEGKVYIMAMDFSDNGQYHIQSLGSNSEYLDKKIESVRPLSKHKNLTWEQKPDGLHIQVDTSGKYACVFEVTL